MKTKKEPRALLKKSHAHKSKKDYDRKNDYADSWQKEIDAGLPNMNIVDWDEVTDKSGGHK